MIYDSIAIANFVPKKQKYINKEVAVKIVFERRAAVVHQSAKTQKFRNNQFEPMCSTCWYKNGSKFLNFMPLYFVV